MKVSILLLPSSGSSRWSIWKAMMMTIHIPSAKIGCGDGCGHDTELEGYERKALGRWIKRHIAPCVPRQRCHCPGDGKQIVFDRLRENSQVVMIDLPKE